MNDHDSGNGDDVSKQVRVWDPIVRVAHWTLVLGFTAAWLSSEHEGPLHIWSGYVVAGVVLLRIVWGFTGGRYARFSAFLAPPSAVIAYLAGLLTGRAKRFVGHNPAGAAMAIALLLALAVTTASGMMVYAIEENAGPLQGLAAVRSDATLQVSVLPVARADDDERAEHGAGGAHGDDGGEEFWEEVHEASANASLGLVILHIAGVLASSLAHRENLPRAMVTGNKRAE